MAVLGWRNQIQQSSQACGGQAATKQMRLTLNQSVISGMDVEKHIFKSLQTNLVLNIIRYMETHLMSFKGVGGMNKWVKENEVQGHVLECYHLICFLPLYLLWLKYDLHVMGVFVECERPVMALRTGLTLLFHSSFIPLSAASWGDAV